VIAVYDSMIVSDETIVNFEHLVSLLEKPYVIRRKFEDLLNLYPAPFDSKILDTHKCKVAVELNILPVVEVKNKIYLIPLTGTDQFAVFPIENL
jgi:hypothetical protein